MLETDRLKPVFGSLPVYYRYELLLWNADTLDEDPSSLMVGGATGLL
jgi:hypothetical protein